MIEQHLLNIEKELQSIRNYLSSFGLSAHREGDRIKVEADKKFSELQFKVGDNHVSVQKMLHSGFEPKPPPLPAKEYLIGNSDNIEKSFEITVGNGYWNGDKYIFEESETITLPKEFETTHKWWGFWDSWNAPDEGMNIFKDYISHIDRVKGKGTLIPHISGFTKDITESDTRSRIKYRVDILDESDDVLFWLLQDEPFLKGFSSEAFEMINDVANEFDIPFGWTLSDNAVNNIDFHSDHEMIIGINTYLFLYEEYPWKFIQTKKEFFDECDRVFNNAREKLPNSKFIFVAQGFYDDEKYRQPPVESVDWTWEYIQRHSDIIGTLWYDWSGKDGKGVKDMPEFYSRLK